MFIMDEAIQNFLSIWLEGFLYGLYSGIFALHLQCHWQSKKSGTTILFYAVCLLYVLSTASFVSDLVVLILSTRVTTLSPQLQVQTDSRLMLSCILIIQAIANGCCDFLAQCILIYRCWIVWGQDIRVVIIPSFLAVAYMAFWLTAYMTTALSEATSILAWVSTLIVTSLTVSMAVNALVTGLIMFKILRVFLKVKPICELASGSAQDTKIQVRHVIFITIESGMALFVVQLIRVVFSIVPLAVEPRSNLYILEYVGVIHQMFNGITPTIIMVLVSMSLSFDDKESFKEATESLCFPTFRSYGNPPSDPDTSSMPPQLGSQGQPEERSDLSEGGVHVAIS